MEINHKIFSTIILLLPLIQELLSVTSESMLQNTGKVAFSQACPENKCGWVNRPSRHDLCC